MNITKATIHFAYHCAELEILAPDGSSAVQSIDFKKNSPRLGFIRDLIEDAIADAPETEAISPK